MKIGEYFVQKNYITQEALNKALELQAGDKSLRLGEILVKMRAISEEDLNQYVINFAKDFDEAGLREATKWLSQKQVDELFAKYSHMKKNN